MLETGELDSDAVGLSDGGTVWESEGDGVHEVHTLPVVDSDAETMNVALGDCVGVLDEVGVALRLLVALRGGVTLGVGICDAVGCRVRVAVGSRVSDADCIPEAVSLGLGLDGVSLLEWLEVGVALTLVLSVALTFVL